MKITAFFILVFGVIVLMLSVNVWTGSLIALLLVTSVLFILRKNLTWMWVDLILLLLLDGYFAFRWFQERELWPYALVGALSVVLTLLLGKQLIDAARS